MPLRLTKLRKPSGTQHSTSKLVPVLNLIYIKRIYIMIPYSQKTSFISKYFMFTGCCFFDKLCYTGVHARRISSACNNCYIQIRILRLCLLTLPSLACTAEYIYLIFNNLCTSCLNRSSVFSGIKLRLGILSYRLS